MAARWEYRQVFGSATRAFAGESDAMIRDAQEQWISNLNALGADGWELVSERFVTSENLVSGERHALYSGTMKRETA